MLRVGLRWRGSCALLRSLNYTGNPAQNAAMRVQSCNLHSGGQARHGVVRQLMMSSNVLLRAAILNKKVY